MVHSGTALSASALDQDDRESSAISGAEAHEPDTNRRIALRTAGSTTTALSAVVCIGIADYAVGPEISFSIFYLVPVSLATWFVSWRLGALVSVLSVLASLGGDLVAGSKFSNSLSWTGIMSLVFYLVVVRLLTKLHAAQSHLEKRVQERTAALTKEMRERERLEREILEILEREQRRISHALHDDLCQHLIATALAGQVLEEKLSARLLPEGAEAARIVALLEAAISLARNVARALHPVEVDGEGLMSAFEEMSNSVSDRYKVACRFEFESPVIINEPATATHLYRIAHEAVINAIRHGKAKCVSIRLVRILDQLLLSVTDDGLGVPDQPRANRSGLGIQIMAHRARMIGGIFEVCRGRSGGTIVTCRLPISRSGVEEGGNGHA